MPLLISAVLLPGEPLPQAEPELARPRIIWEGPNGDRIVFADRDGDVVLGMNRSGEDMPTPTYVEDDVIDGPGTTVRGGAAGVRLYRLPGIVTRETWAQWRAVQQRVARALWTLGPGGEPAPGRLTVEQPDGSARTIDEAYYLSGGEGEEINNFPVYYREWVLIFRCTDPNPRGDEQVITWGASDPVPSFPRLPVRLGSSRLLGTRTVTLQGDVATYAVWSITGPADGLTTLRSDTLTARFGTPQEIVLDLSGPRALTAGQTVTVDMRRGRTRGVRGPDGSSWWGTRVGVPVMFPLVGGENQLTASVEGSSPGLTRIGAAYRPTFHTF